MTIKPNTGHRFSIIRGDKYVALNENTASSRLNNYISGSSKSFVYKTSKKEDLAKGKYWGSSFSSNGFQSGVVHGNSMEDVCQKIEGLFDEWKLQQSSS